MGLLILLAIWTMRGVGVRRTTVGYILVQVRYEGVLELRLDH